MFAATVQAKPSRDVARVHGVCAVANQSESDYEFNRAVNACAHPTTIDTQPAVRIFNDSGPERKSFSNRQLQVR